MFVNTIIHRVTLACLLTAFLVFANVSAFGQSTAFSYQGRLTDAGNVASGNFDMQFKLFDTATVGTGTQHGTTLTQTNITVSAGLFAVQLDFGACASCFNGSPRFLEIAVKPTSGATFTTLGPRQPISATPYAIKSQSATTADGLSVACVSCVTSSQIQGVQGAQVTGTIPVASVPAGSTNYIQNTTTQQATTNFNISGSGIVGGTLTGGVVNATTQFNLGGARILSNTGDRNLFAGNSAGENITTGFENAFFGFEAGKALITGAGNSFFGARAGLFTTGSQNSFFGQQAGRSNIFGSQNSYFGLFAGAFKQDGQDNSFFGALAGGSSTTYFGATAVGASADALGHNSTAIGYKAIVSADNSLVLGSVNGVNGATASVNVGIGTTSPQHRLDVRGVISTSTQYNIGLTRMLAANGPFDSGVAPSLAVSNTFVGEKAGLNTAPNPTLTSGEGKNNSFFGATAGEDNTTGSTNSFFGVLAGAANTTGVGNAFFGVQAGVGNNTGSFNTAIGLLANVGSNSLTNATAIGARARVDQSNSIVLGGITGVNQGTSVNVGIGTTTPGAKLTISGTGSFDTSGAARLDLINTAATSSYSLHVTDAGLWQVATTAGASRLVINSAGNVGIGDTTPVDKLDVEGDIRVGTGTTGCVKDADASVIAGICSSDVRLKRDITPFPQLLDQLVHLRPVHFYWRTDQFPDRHLGSSQSFGLVAQEVEQVMPELVTEDERGYKVVRYHKLPFLMLEAIKELKTENDALKRRLDEMSRQREAITEQQMQIEGLKKIVCLDHPEADLCRSREAGAPGRKQ